MLLTFVFKTLFNLHICFIFNNNTVQANWYDSCKGRMMITSKKYCRILFSDNYITWTSLHGTYLANFCAKRRMCNQHLHVEPLSGTFDMKWMLGKVS